MKNIDLGRSHSITTCRHGIRMAVGLLLFAGCTEQGTQQAPVRPGSAAASGSPDAVKPSVQRIDATADPGRQSSDVDNIFDFKPLTLNNLPQLPRSNGEAAASAVAVDPEKQIQTVIAQLQPLQVLLGQWRGTTRREYESFKAVDSHEWVWDLRTEPDRPALTVASDKSPYLRTGRLSWDSLRDRFTLAAVDASDSARKFTGSFSEPVHEVVGSDDKLHRVFRLEFTEEAAVSGREQWQLAFVQQENNRYLLEVSKRRGSAQFARFDTVSTQREGTSFAVSDTGYAEKTCIISEGLGTTELTYNGRSYWVCCTGCRAAFEEDPEKWIARAATRPAKP